MTEQELIRRHKVCPKCNVEFCDITKRYVGRCCTSEHSYELMSETRHKNGSYTPTQEQRDKIAHSNKMLYVSGFVYPESARKSISEKVKLAWASGSTLENSRLTFKKKYGYDHWTQAPENKSKITTITKGRKFSDAQKKRMSISASKRVRSSRELYTSARGGFREDLNCYFRSRWEANYARILNYNCTNWQYEPDTFYLNDISCSYVPDFKLSDNHFVEVKGRMQEKDAAQIQTFRKMFPEKKLDVVGPDEYKSYKEKYKDLILLWE